MGEGANCGIFGDNWATRRKDNTDQSIGAQLPIINNSNIGNTSAMNTSQGIGALQAETGYFDKSLTQGQGSYIWASSQMRATSSKNL